MPVTFDPGAEPGLIRLAGEIDISQADELKRVLLEALQEKRELRISLQAATGMDMTGVQLLWAAEREARTAGTALTLQGTLPEALRTTLREAGLDCFLLAGQPELSSEVH